ncbi:acylaminoacyl-peptidase [Ktedonobacteria bacterium brp13]|nr:acylaminoacyl-peptidase [Ktedonobacteria bacterium brp13]
MSELTAEQIVDLAVPIDLQISPDGSQVAYTLNPLSKKDEHGTSNIWVAPIDGSSPAQQFTSGDTKDHRPQWSPDGRHLALLSDRSQRGTAQLYLLPVNGGEARPLTSKDNEKAVEQFVWSPRGGQIAFTSADEPSEEDKKRTQERDDARVYGERHPYARLRLISLASQEVTTLVSGERHIADLVWHPHGTELAYVVWQTPELESGDREQVIERISLAGGEPHRVCRWSGSIENLTWSSDGETLFFLSPISGKPQASSAVYAVSAQGGDPRCIAGGETDCVLGLHSLSQGQHVAGFIAKGLDTQIYQLDGQNGQILQLSPTVDKQQVGDASITTGHVRITEDGRTVLAVTRSSSNQPGQVWAGFAEQGERITALKQLSSHHDGVSGITFAQQQPFYWTAPDGWELDGLLLLPHNVPDGQPLPMIVLVHGGPYGRWNPGFNLSWGNWGQWLALAGYAVLMPNPRGGYGHGERFASAARSDVGGADFADVMSAVDAAIERGIADPDRLGIGGWSQGGFMSAWAVTQTTRFKAAIMGAGVSDWGMMVLTSDMPDFELALGGTAPWDGIDAQRHRELSPITFAHQVKTPVLILHGENDARVPLSQATGFYRALRRYDVPTEMVAYPREPHGISERAHQLDLLRRVRSWYDRWLRV